MKYKKNISLLLLYSIFLISACNKKIKIEEMKTLRYTETGVDGEFLLDNFLITGFVDNNHMDRVIDSFAAEQISFKSKKYKQYDILFYKSSWKTNMRNIEKDKKIIDRYSQKYDLVYSYSCMNGVFSHAMKHKGYKTKSLHPKKLNDKYQ